MNKTVQKVRKKKEQVEVVNSGMIGNYLLLYELFGFIQPDLQVFSFLEVSHWDDLAHIIVDGVELGHSVNRTRQNYSTPWTIDALTADHHY